MRIVLSFVVSTVFLSSCFKELPQDGIPAFLQVDSALTYDLSGMPTTNDIYSIEVYASNQDRGNWPMPASVPLLLEGVNSVTITPYVLYNNNSSLLFKHPFLEISDDTMTFTRSTKVNYIPKFKQKSVVTYLADENFEGFANFTNANLSSNARSGIGSLEILADVTLNDSTAIAVYDFELTVSSLQQGIMEFDYQLEDGILAPAVIYTDNNGVERYSYSQYFLTNTSKWKHVYWDIRTEMENALALQPNGTKKLCFILTTANGKNSTKAYIDNLKIIQ